MADGGDNPGGFPVALWEGNSDRVTGCRLAVTPAFFSMLTPPSWMFFAACFLLGGLVGGQL